MRFGFSKASVPRDSSGGERGGLDRLAEVGGERAGGLVAALETAERLLERVVGGQGRGGREGQPENERQGSSHAEPSFTVSRAARKRAAAPTTLGFVQFACDCVVVVARGRMIRCTGSLAL